MAGLLKFPHMALFAMSVAKSKIDQLADAYDAKAQERYGAESTGYLELSIDIEDWRTLRKAVADLTSGAGVTSYSIAGRSVTRNDLGALRDQLAELEDHIKACLGMGGGVLIADMTGGC